MCQSSSLSTCVCVNQLAGVHVYVSISWLGYMCMCQSPTLLHLLQYMCMCQSPNWGMCVCDIQMAGACVNVSVR